MADADSALPTRRDSMNESPPGSTRPRQVMAFFKAAELIIQVLAVMAAALEVLPQFLPAPALVYSFSTFKVPGDYFVITHFLNSTSSTPLEKIQGLWDVEDERVQILVSDDAPPHYLLKPAPKQRELQLNAALPGASEFSVFLRSNHTFDVTHYDFHAAAPKVTDNGVEDVPVAALSQQAWDERQRKTYYWLLGGLIALGAAVVILHRGFQRIERSL